MWKRALKPLPTNPMPRRSVLIRVAEEFRVQSSVGSEAQFRAIELGVAHAELVESRRRAAVPLMNEKVAHVLQVLDANLAGPEAGGRQITEPIKKGNAICHAGRSARRPRDVVENHLALRLRSVGERLSKS